MAQDIRLNKIAKELNVGINTIVEFLHKKGFVVDANPNSKIDNNQYAMLIKEYSSDMLAKKQVEKQVETEKKRKETITAGKEQKRKAEQPAQENREKEKQGLKIIGKLDLSQNDKTKTSNTQQQQQKTADDNKPKQPVQQDNTKTSTPDNNSAGQQRSGDKKKNQGQKPQQKEDRQPKVVGKIDLDNLNKPKNDKKQQGERRDDRDRRRNEIQLSDESAPKNDEIFAPTVKKIVGPTIVGKIELHDEPKNQGSRKQGKKKRRRIGKEPVDIQQKDERQQKDGDKNRQKNKQKGDQKNDNRNENRNNESKKRDKKRRNEVIKKEITEEDTQKQVKETLARLTNTGKSATSKHNREKRDKIHRRIDEENKLAEEQEKILEVTAFITTNELATMMNVSVAEIIVTCMNLGYTVTINQRLDVELIAVIAEEFGYEVKFIDEEDEDPEKDLDPADMKPRPRVVTVMGHVDHGKTKLLDYIRQTNVVAGEAGGITQHIGAYNVELPNGKHITFLDTPGHEAFAAMRARGAKITDIVVIVIAADSHVMPTTEEAINHAKAANVPIVFAINKIDVPSADPERIKLELSERGLQVEDWGGPYGCIEISAKQGLHVDDLLERILLEAEMLELKACYTCPAFGTVVEAALDQGRGHVSTVVVSHGILRVGDAVLAGSHSGKIKAMFNERNKRIKQVGPGEPAILLGLDGAPNAGDKFTVMADERTAREKAVRRMQIEREIKTNIDVMGLRKIVDQVIKKDKAPDDANVQDVQLNLVIKGDVQGSIEALHNSLEELSKEHISVKVIHTGVGQISENDVMLAKASKAIIIGFQVRPSLSAKRLAEKDGVEIRLYSIIYDTINDIKEALEGMLSPDIKEEITGSAEIMEIFKISKVGNIAGCIVRDGKIVRKNKCRVIREGIVVYTGDLGSLKRFKDDVAEVTNGMECGLNIDKFNDIKVGDIIESYEEKEVKRKL